MTERPTSGGDPETLGRCTECGAVYPVQRTPAGRFRVVGTGGSCGCGSAEFDPLDEV